MKKIKHILLLKEQNLDIKYFFILMVIAYLFSVAIRYIWLDTFSAYENFQWMGQVMINTNDGYYYAEGARDLLQGTHQANDLSPVLSPLSELTAFLERLFPISLETLILWMPALFSSLLVIPIMLLGRAFKQDLLGFSAALLGSIAWSYYNRTMIGYYDTDMLVVVLPAFVTWATIYALGHHTIKSFLFAPLFAIASISWHAGTVNIVNGIFIMTLLYTLIYERRNLHFYKFLTVYMIVLTTLPLWLKVFFVFSLIGVYEVMKEKLSDKFVVIIAIVSTLLYLVFGGFDWIVSILNNAYITRLMAAELDFTSLKFYGVVNTVREAGHIPFEVFANRISGSVAIFWLSLLGYILFVIRYKLFMISLPMVVLGFFALQGGLRFTVFSVPFMALGYMYLVFLVAQKFQTFFEEKKQHLAYYSFIALATIMALYPNIKHVIAYKVPTVFMKNDVAVLDQLGKIASREDYVVSWWDYGYPIRYYANVKTLIDGGKHSGKVNYTVSLALTGDQVTGANIARMDVEFTEKSFKEDCGSSIECMLKAYNVKDPNRFFKSLKSKTVELPAKTRDVYFYLPNKMLAIYPTVNVFSNINLFTGKPLKRPFLYMSKNFQEKNNIIYLGNNISLDKKDATVSINGQKIQLHYFIHTSYDKNGKYNVQAKEINKQSSISAIFMQSHNQFLIVDSSVLNSLYFRLFVLENYDHDLFEMVISSPNAKVFKLKI